MSEPLASTGPLVWVDREGESESLRVPPGAYLAPRLSPDGKRVAFNTTTGDWDLWTYDVARRNSLSSTHGGRAIHPSVDT